MPQSMTQANPTAASLITKALKSAMEEQSQPAIGALDYLNFKRMYGREPRQGEMATQMISPWAYLAGQVSGSSIAGGAPGPRYGSMLVKDPYAPYIPTLPKEGIARAVRGMGREAIEFLRNRLGKIHLGPGMGVIGQTMPREGAIRISKDLTKPALGINPTQVLEHELGHTVFNLAPKRAIYPPPEELKLRNFFKKPKPTPNIGSKMVDVGLDLNNWTPELEDSTVGLGGWFVDPATRTRLYEKRRYNPQVVADQNPSEIFAVGSETPLNEAGQLMTPQGRQKVTDARRLLRGWLKSYMRSVGQISGGD